MYGPAVKNAQNVFIVDQIAVDEANCSIRMNEVPPSSKPNVETC